LFAWKLLNYHLPTKTNLIHRGVHIVGSPLCVGCDVSEICVAATLRTKDNF